MPTRDINLTDQHDEFVQSSIDSGHYQNATEVVCEGLRLLQRRNEIDEAKVAVLRRLADEGLADLESGKFKSLTAEGLSALLDRISDASQRDVSASC